MDLGLAGDAELGEKPPMHMRGSSRPSTVRTTEASATEASAISIELPSARVSTLTVDAVVEELRVRRAAIENADRTMEEEEQAQHLRMLQAFEFIGATEHPAAVSLQALHDNEPTLPRRRRPKSFAPHDPETRRLCADFESWLGEEAHRAILSSIQRKLPVERVTDTTRRDPYRRSNIALVIVATIGVATFVLKDLLQVSSIYPTITPDSKVLLERFMVESANAYANETCSPISPWHLARDEVVVVVPTLFYVVTVIQILDVSLMFGIMYSFLHRNIEWAVLRRALRSGHVRAIMVQLTVLLAEGIIKIAVNAQVFGAWYAMRIVNIMVFNAGIVTVVVMDAARIKHPITRTFGFLLGVLLTTMQVMQHFFFLSASDMIDVVAFFRFCGAGGSFIKPIYLTEVQLSMHISLLFVLVTAFRKVLADPNKVCFVPFHFKLEEVEEMLAAKAHEDLHRPRKTGCCSRLRPKPDSRHTPPPTSASRARLPVPVLRSREDGSERVSLRDRVSIGD